ncbi:MAG: 50S ribosomal protein L5 [Patescibacteria group bacterium]
MAVLLSHYRTAVIPALQKEFGYSNALAVPRVLKVIVQAGVGKRSKDGAEHNERTMQLLARITGQKPAPRAARKSIAGFKMREGMIVGMQVTLRGARMYDFLERLLTVVLPRTRDFHGVSAQGFDGRGNYSLGFPEVNAFPEVNPEDIELGQGLQITVTTNARTNARGVALLKALGFPFRDVLKK